MSSSLSFPRLFRISVAFILAAGAFVVPMAAQEIHQERGADSRVDYESLTRFGPWDDRNYQLTLEDLAELRDDEQRYRDPIPAFYRVGIRRAENLRGGSKTGYYPLFAVPAFRIGYGGYLVEGQLYRGAELLDGRFVISGQEPIQSHEEFLTQKAFGGESQVNANAAESAIKIHPSNPQLVIAGSNGPGGNEMHFSSDGGASWSETSLPLGNTCCDPTVDWNAAGTLAHTATLGNCGFAGCGIWYYRSDDNGQTWSDLEDDSPGDPRREVGTGDKEFLHVDRFSGSPHSDNIYLSWHDLNILRIARSSDDGDTWSTVVHNSDPSGIGSDVTTDRAGNVYHFYPTLEGEGTSRIAMKKSTDGGATFTAGVVTVAPTENSFNFFIPINDQRGVATIIGVDADVTEGSFSNSLYAAWTDSTGPDTGNPNTTHARIQVAYSRDAGATWTTVTPHPTADAETVDRFHSWIAVGPDGKVWVAFYETAPGNREQLDFVYTSSSDGGATWEATIKLTAQSSTDPNDSFEWGDYNGLDVVGDQLITIFTDNRDGDNTLDVFAAGAEAASSSIFSDGFESGSPSAWSTSMP